jgi:hypothetical protein
MECVIGIVGKDFVLVASDTNQAHSIVIMKQGKHASVCFFYNEKDLIILFKKRR